jgi:hypothetical protein
MIGDVINFGVADAATVASALGLPEAAMGKAADIDTVDIDVESTAIGSGGTSGAGGRADPEMRVLENVTKEQMGSAYLRWHKRPLNTYNLTEDFVLQRWIRRPHIRVGAVIDAEVIDSRTEALRYQVARRTSAELVERTEATTALIRQLAQSAGIDAEPTAQPDQAALLTDYAEGDDLDQWLDDNDPVLEMIALAGVGE